MCIWCLPDGVFTVEEWKEMLEEKLRQPSLLDKVKRFISTENKKITPAATETTPRTS